jgi:hypothetical protein
LVRREDLSVNGSIAAAGDTVCAARPPDRASRAVPDKRKTSKRAHLPLKKKVKRGILTFAKPIHIKRSAYMKTGRFVLQTTKIGGKMREVRGGAVTLSKETLGRDLLTTRVEKRIVMGGWNVESESIEPCTCEVSGEERLIEEIADSDNNGRSLRLRSAVIVVPKLTGSSTRIDAKLPRFGQKGTAPTMIPAVEFEPVPIPEPEKFVPDVLAEAPAKPTKISKVKAKVDEVPVKKLRKPKPMPVEPVQAVIKEEPPIPVVELKPSEPEAPEASADVKIQVVPTPRKRQPRIPEPQVESAVSATPKPIKVIRRRAEEAPKVFETAPKTVPKAMMEGVKLLMDEEGENPIE